jgi:hypothetical protein
VSGFVSVRFRFVLVGLCSVSVRFHFGFGLVSVRLFVLSICFLLFSSINLTIPLTRASTKKCQHGAVEHKATRDFAAAHTTIRVTPTPNRAGT